MTLVLLLALALPAPAQTLPDLRVGPAAPAYATVQEAVDAAPATGAVLHLAPGIYREVVHIDKPNIQLRGESSDPTQTVIVFDSGDPKTCTTFCSPTVFVTGDNFFATNITIANDLSKRGKPRTQGVALSLTGDRAVLRHVRLLGAQDTLFASSRPCKADATAPCVIARQYFDDCYIEGEVDFIFGNAKAFFNHCEIHSVAHAGGYLTAQSRTALTQDSGYAFDHCRTTADPDVRNVYLGRPWRDFATVTFLNTELGAHIAAAGWSEWHPNETDRLKTAAYSEFNSTGPGANPTAREPLSHQLTKAEAASFTPALFLAGTDHWDPTAIR